MRNTPKWKTTLAALAVGALLTACGGGGATTDPTTTEPAQPTPAQTVPSHESPSQAPDDVPAVVTAGFAAIELAEAEVPGSQAISLDANDDGEWDVEVLLGDREYEFEISADGTQILERDEDDADNDDVELLATAVITLPEAINIALGQTDGTFDDADLDEDTRAWQVDFDDPDDREIHVDVVSGEIVRG